MKKNILTIALLTFANLAFAQFTNVKDTIFATMPINSSKSIWDTLENFGGAAIPFSWNLSTSTIIAPGHSGVSVCSFPGACYPFDNMPHSEVANPNSILLFSLTWEIDATAAIGSTSYVVLNTDINGGKNLVRKITAVGPSSTESLEIPSIKLYPTPCYDVLNIELSDIYDSKIEITNTLGLVVNTITTSGKLKTEIAVDNLMPGLYLVNIYNTNNTILARKKMIKN